MKLLNITSGINDRYLDEIVRCLRAGGIIIYPTDTVYALGCDALNNQAIERICTIKAMKSAKTNLTIICSDISEVTNYAKFGNNEFRMMKRNVPGPFTFIYPALSRLPKAFKGRRTVGVRIPDCDIACAIVKALERPILSTSVEGNDDDYMCEPELLAETYQGQVDIIVNAGRSGSEHSTIVDCTTDGEPEITRQGKGILQ